MGNVFDWVLRWYSLYFASVSFALSLIFVITNSSCVFGVHAIPTLNVGKIFKRKIQQAY